tara:strand:+ start:344 stop:490 length:147 start_codon:yes stop_codon:yes gene_type:complete
MKRTPFKLKSGNNPDRGALSGGIEAVAERYGSLLLKKTKRKPEKKGKK